MSEVAAEVGIERNARGELVLDIDALRPKPRWLRLPGPGGDRVEVKIPGELSIQDMLDLRSIEQTIRNRQTSGDEMIAELQNFMGFLRRVIDRENPGNEVQLDLGVVDATRLLIFLAQPDDSIAENFVKAISDPEGGEKPDAAKAARRLARDAGLEDPGEAESARPLRSGKRSSSPSSRSASSTTGRRSGGKTPAARGPRSGSTSRSRAKGRASGKKT